MTQERLQTNHNFLARYFPDLSTRIQNDSIPAGIGLEFNITDGKRGMKTVHVNSTNGAKPLHSQYDPISEAVRWAESVEVPTGSIVLFLGWGMGYPVLEWVERYGANTNGIIIWEPEPQLFLESLKYIDLRRLAQAGQMKIVLGREEGAIYQSLHSVLSSLLSRDLSIQPMPFADIYPAEVIEQLKRETQQIMAQREAALQHMANTGYQTQHNIIGNLRFAPQCWLPHDIHNLGKNQPAIIVAAGPSLDKNIDQLSNAIGKAWIFSVDTSLRILQRHNIDPHFVVTKDFTDLNRSHFEGMQNLESPVLAFDPQIPPEITAKFTSPKVWLPNRNRQLHAFLKEFELTEFDLMPHSTNVALTAFNLAHGMGCSPIIFVGLDLCFCSEKGNSHATNSALVSNVQFDTQSKRMQYTRGEASDTVEALMVEGIDGKRYPTVPNFYEALKLLERLIQEANAHTIDASEGGAKIQGTEIMSLNAAIEQHCQTAIQTQMPVEKLPRDTEALKRSIQDIAEFINENREMAFDLMNQFKDIDCPDCINFATFENQRRGVESDQKLYRLLESALERLLVEIDKPGYFDDRLPPTDLMQHYATYFSKLEEACSTFVEKYEEAGKALE